MSRLCPLSYGEDAARPQCRARDRRQGGTQGSEGQGGGVTRIAVAFDGDDVSKHTLDVACRTASGHGDEVHVVQVIRIPPQLPIYAELPAARARADALFARAARLAGENGPLLVDVLVTARALGPGLVAAIDGCDLLVLGQPARRSLFRRLRSMRVVRYVLAHASCDVLLAYEPAATARPRRFVSAVSTVPAVVLGREAGMWDNAPAPRVWRVPRSSWKLVEGATDASGRPWRRWDDAWTTVSALGRSDTEDQ